MDTRNGHKRASVGGGGGAGGGFRILLSMAIYRDSEKRESLGQLSKNKLIKTHEEEKTHRMIHETRKQSFDVHSIA